MYWLEQLKPTNTYDIVLYAAILIGIAVTFGGLWYLYKKLKTENLKLKTIVAVSSFVCGVLTLFLVYSTWVEPNLLTTKSYQWDVENVELEQPIKIVVIGDLQWKGTISPSFVQHIADQVIATDPDLVIWVGDLVNYKKEELENVSAFADITSRYGNYAILGNHDYGLGETKRAEVVAETQQAVEDFWEQAGFTVLTGEVEELTINNTTIALAGIHDIWVETKGLPQVWDEVAELDSDVKLLLAHQPLSVELAPAGLFDLTLSGHCHGGQLDLGPLFRPLIDPIALVPGCKRVDGKLTEFVEIADQPVFITPGIGSVEIRLRYRVLPEVSVLEIY